VVDSEERILKTNNCGERNEASEKKARFIKLVHYLCDEKKAIKLVHYLYDEKKARFSSVSLDVGQFILRAF
jgi:hypothetical protein